MPRVVHPTLSVTLIVFCVLAALAPSRSSAQPVSRHFPETGYSVREPFLSAWEQGGIALFGQPISGELTERSRDDGRLYTVQYFERARLELHSDPDQPIKVGRLGAELAPPATIASTCAPFPETGYGICGELGAFWSANGGVAAFGYPVGPAQLTIGPDGVVREVQYTERARIERAVAGGQITLGLLGRERLAVEPLPPPPPLPPPLVAPEIQRIVDLVNAERAAASLGPLQLAQELSVAAQAQSEGMAYTGFISHTGADGRGPAERIADAGYRWLRCGENIAVGQPTPEEAMAFWMGSPPHRANILDSGMREIGVGYLWLPGGYGHYWTITLGER
jgi:uncharacterized protein YkwD